MKSSLLFVQNKYLSMFVVFSTCTTSLKAQHPLPRNGIKNGEGAAGGGGVAKKWSSD